MESTTLLVLLVAVAIAGAVAVAVILAARGRRLEQEDQPYAASTEGDTRCAACGMGNIWTERTCSSCGAPLPR